MDMKQIAILLSAAFLAAAANAQGLSGRTGLPQRAGSRSAQKNASSAPSPNAAASSSAVDEEVEKGKTPDLDFNEAPLDMVLEIYGKLVDRTVLKDPGVPQANITMQSRPGQKLSREKQIEAIEALLEMNGVHMENYGEEFVRALPRERARTEGIPVITDDQAEIDDSVKVASAMISFKNIPIEEAKTVLEGLKSQKGLLLVYERIGKILVTDTMQNINRMREIAREIDVATPINENVFVRQIKHANANDIKTAIEYIVNESQKELEKAGKAAKSAEQDRDRDRGFRGFPQPPGAGGFRRPGGNGNSREETASTQAKTVESLVTSVSDADRGMIRGKVLITADERSNKLIVITAKTNMDFFDKIIEQLDVETTPDTVVKVYRLKYAEAEDVSDMINDLIGNTSKSSSSSRDNQNAAARSGTGGNITRGSQQNTRPATGTPANQRTGDAKAGELSKDNTTVLADKRINGIVVMTQKELVPTIESIIDSMDVKLSQVLIETAIVEVTLGDELKTGIDWVQRGKQRVTTSEQAYDRYGRPLWWDFDTDGNASISTTESDWPVMKRVTSTVRDGFVNNSNYMMGGGGGTGSSLLSTMMGASTNIVDGAMWGGANPIGSGINYLLKSDKLNIAAVIQASKEDSRSKYVASPIIMTVDNKEAEIAATQMRYLLKGYTYSGSTYNGTTVPDYEQKEIGLTIKVTPKINPNGTVMLKVEEDYSQVGANQSIQANVGGSTTSSVSVPTTVTRKMSADITLDDRQTVVLGGLTETIISESETGIPILKDIPWIGKWLFSSTEQSEGRKELLVFMTPYVLNDSESAQAEAMRRKNSLSDVRPWENNGGWSASELADPVAKKELLKRLKEEAKKQDEERQNRLAIEKWKMDRAKELEKMSEAERKFWLEEHKDELESKEKKKEFEETIGGYSQEDLKKLAEQIREDRLKKAEETTAEETAREKGKEGHESAT